MNAPRPASRMEVARLGLIAAWMLVPVTLPVPVLRGLVQERFDVSDLATSLFMSINMIGAFFAAPLAGAVADKLGRTRQLIAIALGVDALCFYAMTRDMPFAAFLSIRLVEGVAHITALSLLLGTAAERARHGRRGAVMGAVGAGLTFGVAMGAPIGGALGRVDPLRPLQVGAIVVAALIPAVLLGLPNVRRGDERPGLREIARSLQRHSSLWIPYAYAFADRFTVGFFTTTFTLYLKRTHELPVERVGMLLGMFLGPFALLSYPFGRWSERYSRRALLAGGSFCYGIAVMAVGVWPVDWLPILMVTLGVLSAVMFVPSLILTSEVAPPRIRTTALGGFNAAGSLGFICGPLVGGAVSQFVAGHADWATGYAVAFVVAGSTEVLCVAITWRGLRKLADQGRTPPDAN